MFQPMTAFPSPAVGHQPLAITESTMPLSFEGVETDEPKSGFADLVGKAIDAVEAPGHDEDKMVQDYLAGKPVDTHDIMIAGSQSDMMLQLSSAIISKVANAYQTLINMQV